MSDATVVDAFELDEPEWPRSFDGMLKPPEEFVCSVCEALEPGDKVLLNARSRPIEVIGFEEQMNPGVIGGSDYPYYIWWLRGNGTEYRLRWSHTREYYPSVHTESQLKTTESFSVKHQEPRIHTIADGRGERVRWVQPDGVSESELTDWVLSRKLEVQTDE